MSIMVWKILRKLPKPLLLVLFLLLLAAVARAEPIRSSLSTVPANLEKGHRARIFQHFCCPRPALVWRRPGGSGGNRSYTPFR